MSATSTITTTTVREIETDNRERSLWEILKSFPRPVWVVFGGMFINRFGTFVIPFLALHLKTLGYTTGQVGLGIACYGFGHFIATFVGGHLTDTLGRRKTIVLSMFSSAATMVFLAQAAELKCILFLASLAGFTGELYRPASSALLTDLVPEKDRVTAFAVYRFAINAGWAFGPATAGLLAKHSYSWLFYVDGITSLAYGIIAIHLLPRREMFTEIHANSRPRDGFWKGLKTATNAAIGNKRFLQVVMASFAVALGFMQIFSTFGLEVKSNGFHETGYGILLALNGVLIICFEIPLSSYTRRMAPRPTMAIGYLLIGGGLSAVAWADSLGSYAFAMVLFTFGEMICMPITMAYAANLAPSNMRGRFMGLFGLTWASALLVGPALGMLLFEWNPSALWIGCGILSVTAATIILKRI